jgi:hypothetical protein
MYDPRLASLPRPVFYYGKVLYSATQQSIHICQFVPISRKNIPNAYKVYI